MQITFLGQAGLYIETKGKSILCDPWFNPAYFGSWFPFPSNEKIDPNRIGSPTYLYISHLHHDHYDPEFLAKHVSKDATVILPDYPLDHQERELRALGFSSFLRTKNTVPVTVDDLTFMVMALTAPTDGPIGDSALCIDDGDVRVLNQNDSRPIDLEPLLAQGPFDALFLQFSGAIWYPMVYDFPQKMTAALGKKKRTDGMARAYRYIEMLNPQFVVPSAGPPCFLDEDLFSFNDVERDPANTFPDQMVFLEYMAERAGPFDGRLMIPGSVGELQPGSFTITHPVPGDEVKAIFTDKQTYLRAYQKRKWPVIEQEHATWARGRVDVLQALKDWFEPLLAQADYICAGVNDAVLLDLNDLGVLIDFRTRAVTKWEGEEWTYRFRIDRALVEECILHHHEDWVNELFLSCRFEASRRGKYNDYIYTFFKCLSEERLQYAEGFYAEHGPTQGTWEACGYRIQKRCPHMKADLTRFAVIEDGILTCRLHNWQYELATGRCLTSEGHTLYAKPIEQDDQPSESSALSAD